MELTKTVCFFLPNKISILLFFLKASSVFLLVRGENSPNPAAINLFGGIPFSIKKFTILIDLALDKCQFERNCSLKMGLLSVCPSILSTQSISFGMISEISFRVLAILFNSFLAFSSKVSSALLKKISDGRINLSPETKTSIWPVAIYAPEVSGTPTTDCLIYHKNRSNEDLAYVKQLLSDRRLTYTQLQYGSYSQDDFRQALSSVRFCIIIDNTESQGIAIGEMMAAGKPLFVWDQPVWDHMGEQYKIDATTVPYWDDMCGEKTTERSELSNLFDKFL